jgi:hypothetical protein
MVHGLRIALEFFNGVIDENDDVRSGAQIILDTRQGCFHALSKHLEGNLHSLHQLLTNHGTDIVCGFTFCPAHHL